MQNSEYLDRALKENPSSHHHRKPNLRDWVLIKDQEETVSYKAIVEKTNEDVFLGIIKMITDGSQYDPRHHSKIGKKIIFTRKNLWDVRCT